MTAERILVVDDEPGMLRSVERILSPQYPTVTARTPRQAIEQLDRFEPDLAILDIRMPEIDGFELMGRLRELRPDLDVVFMTGVVHERDTQMIRSIREKAFYFIQKPFDREVLLTLVERCLELRRATRANREYTRRIEGQLEDARRFQQSLLPARSAQIEGIAIAARYRPCEELGGDFYDYVQAGDGAAACLVGDVCGHGASASMLTAIVKSAFHEGSADAFDPLSAIRRISRSLRTFDTSRFVTAFCARLDRKEGTLDYVNAGHPAALQWGGDGEKRELSSTGPLISPAFPESTWEKAREPWTAGQRLLIYTDGLTEVHGPDGFYGEDRLLALLSKSHRKGEELLDEILASARSFAEGRPETDDQTLLTAAMD